MNLATENIQHLLPQQAAPTLNGRESPAAMRKVAEEFESLFMNMMMKSMRSANRTLSEGNYFNSFETKMYEDMLDEKLSGELSQSGGLGIADLLMKQFSGEDLEPRYQLQMGKQEVLPAERREAFGSASDFVDQLLPQAKQAAESLNTKPEFIVAQAALETGWGKHVMFTGTGQNSHNIFGIKADADWQGDTVNIDSLEVNQGLAKPVSSAFKVYDSYQHAFQDYAQLIGSNGRYEAVKNAEDISQFAHALKAGGYATDPAYPEKITRVFGSISSELAAVRSY